jgi:hypothetical protein
VFIGAAGLAMWHWAVVDPDPPAAVCADPFPTVYRDGVPVMPEDLDR